MWKRYVLIGIVYLLVNGVGALDAWLSLFDRFFGENKQVTVVVGDWYQALFPILGLAVLFFGVWWTRPGKVAKPEKIVPSVSKETIELAGEMKAEVRKDGNNFAQRLFIHNIKINWLPLLETDPYFTIDFDVYSSSVLRLDIGGKYEGHLRYGINPMERTIEVMKPIKDLERSSTQLLRLRQWVSPPRLTQIKSDGGKIAHLHFSDINIRVEGKLPAQSTSLISRLPLPNQLDEIIPTMDELNAQ